MEQKNQIVNRRDFVNNLNNLVTEDAFRNAVGDHGIILHIINEQNNSTVFSKPVKVSRDKFGEYSSLLNWVLEKRNNNLQTDAELEEPIAELRLGSFYFAVIGLEKFQGETCILAIAVKLKLITEDQLTELNAS